MQNGVAAKALVLDKKVYAVLGNTGRAVACHYQLRVKFDDGSTAEISRRVWNRKLAYALVGDLIPVRYDPADRSKIEFDREAINAERDAQSRELKEQAIAQGEEKLERS